MLPYIDIIQGVLGNTGLRIWKNYGRSQRMYIVFRTSQHLDVIDLSSCADEKPLS